MYEYQLYSQIPAAREQQVLNILAGVTATQPVPICEQTLVYAQVKVPEPAVPKKSKQQQPKQAPVPNYHKLVRDVELKNVLVVKSSPWRFRVEQLPEPGIQTHILRGVTEQNVGEDQVARFKDPAWYRYKQQYTLVGNRFVHNNIIIRIVRFYVPGAAISSDPIEIPPYAPADLKLLDPSGSWVVESTIRLEGISNSAITDQAKKELAAFQFKMEGALDLYAPDRLSLDTRVKNT